ncbi:Spy/CpxP family protein refolding chaperone [Sinorhizobium sp. BG8]|uniref:Spy/CpxP family protein refolding chaperone n=1 Tax=Sinorhizobium sp. BG8 TaxID=2613773 RepID=UPI00193DE496|nr:Spy/CpxP family protein refolding chaperone [Sinorhizobium sp. BG8]QRM54703.1 hypothetical protein F3Y30_09235 [Sinorhizobium sp. BG8]
MTNLVKDTQRRFRAGLALAIILPLTAAVTIPAIAQDRDQPPGAMEDRIQPDADRADGRDMPPRFHMRDRDRDGDRDMRPLMWHDMARDMGPRHGPRRGPPMAEMIAIKLAAAEQAAGIKSSQLDAWRTFSAALIDFMQPSRPDMPPADAPDDAADAAPDAAPDAGQQPPAGGADQATADDAQRPGDRPGRDGDRRGFRDMNAFELLDRLVARAESRAEKAEKLKAALTQLQAVLEPEQKAKLEKLLLPPHHFRGPGPGKP